MMWKQAGLAAGAGVASALLFVVSAKGTVLASLMAYFAALPIIIAALAFGHLSGLGSAVIGAGVVGVATSPLLAAFFALFFALPGWWLAYLAGLAKPVPAVAPAPGAAPLPLDWYPVGRLVAWAAALAAGLVLVTGVLAVAHFGGFEKAAAHLASRLDDALADGERGGATPADLARFVVRVLPLGLAASLCPMLCANLWLGARVAQTSQRLARPWPNVPDGLRLPKIVAVLFILCVPPVLLGGVVATACGVVAAAFGMALAFQGLAAAHVLTRGLAARRGVLALIYIVTLVVPLAVLALTLIGIVDCLFSLRGRRPPAPLSPSNPRGV